MTEIMTTRHLALGAILAAGTAFGGVLATSSRADAQSGPTIHLASPLPLPVTGTVALSSHREPFQTGMVATGFSGGSGSAELVTVPEGKRLVLEHVSAWINTASPDGLSAVTFAVAGVLDTPLCQQTGKTPNGLNHFFSCSGSTRLYAEAGQTVTLFVGTATPDTGFFRGMISGYLEPAP